MPAFLKPAVQHLMATRAANLNGLQQWVSQSAPELLREEGRRYFGKGGSVFRQNSAWIRRRGIGL